MIKKVKSFLFENKTDKQTIIKNTFWLMLAEGISKGGMFLITILIARILGPEEFGVLSFVMSFVAMFIVITDFGLTTLMVREVSRDHSKIQDYLVNLSFLKVVLGIATFLLVWIVSHFIGKDSFYITLILIYCGYSIINNFGEFIRAFFRPSEKMEYEALLKIINGVLMLGIVLYALFVYGDLKSILYGYLVAGILSFVVSILYVWRKFEVGKIRLNGKVIKDSLNSGFFLMGGLIFISFFVSIDSFLLGFYNFNYELGIYSAMVKLTFIPALIVNLFIFSVIPNLIKKYSFSKVISISKKLIIFGLISFIIVTLFGKFIIKLLYGNIYTSGYILLIILFFKFIIVTIDTFLYNLLNSLGHEKRIFYFTIVSGLINLILNIIYIPIYKEMGAVYTTLFSESIFFILIITSYYKVLKINLN